LKKNNRKGQALVESMVLLFPLMLLCFIAFINLHDEVQQDMQNMRALRMAMLHRSAAGNHRIDNLDEKYTENLISYRTRKRFPKTTATQSSQFQDKMPEKNKLDMDKLLEFPAKLLDQIYESKTVTLTFSYKVNNRLVKKLFVKEKKYSASMLTTGNLRKRGREFSSVLGIGAAFYQ